MTIDEVTEGETVTVVSKYSGERIEATVRRPTPGIHATAPLILTWIDWEGGESWGNLDSYDRVKS